MQCSNKWVPPLTMTIDLFLCAAQTNCLEELTRPAPNHQGMAGRSDWVHIYHSVLPVLSLHQVRFRPYCTFVPAILRF